MIDIELPVSLRISNRFLYAAMCDIGPRPMSPYLEQREMRSCARVQRWILICSLALCVPPITGTIATAQQTQSGQPAVPDKSTIDRIGDGIGMIAFGIAWPSATYEGWLFRGVQRSGDEIFLVFRLHGGGIRNDFDQSPDNIWVDLVISVDSNGIDNVQFGRSNGFVPPGFTASATASLVERAAESYAASHPALPPSPPASPPDQYDVASAGGVAAQVDAASRPASDIPASYLDGRRDRGKWENWFAGLAPEPREGADFWAGQRSLPYPQTCEDRTEMSAEWHSGCEVARRILAQSDVRRKSEPQYRAGWNSF